jgi:uncharacterized membrane protein
MPSKSRRLLIASLSTALAAPLAFAPASIHAEEGETVHCYGVNKCKETGDCGGPGHSCANQNACKRKGYIDMDEETCLRLDGGRLTPEPQDKGEAQKDEEKEQH